MLSSTNGCPRVRRYSRISSPRNAAQPLASAAADEVEKRRFGVVAAGVGGGDFAGCCRLQKGVAQPPGGLLRALARLAADGRDVRPLYREGNRQPAAKLPDEGLVPVCLCPAETVVHVGGRNGQAKCLPCLQKQKQKGDGIRSSGKSNGYMVARFHHFVPAQRVGKSIIDRRHIDYPPKQIL